MFGQLTDLYLNCNYPVGTTDPKVLYVSTLRKAGIIYGVIIMLQLLLYYMHMMGAVETLLKEMTMG